MKLKIDYQAELEAMVLHEITFVKEEFKLLFGSKQRFSEKDRTVAIQILNRLSKMISSPDCEMYLSQTLETLGERIS